MEHRLPPGCQPLRRYAAHIAAGAGTLALALVMSGCSSMLYYPTRIEHADRAKMAVKPVDLTFKSEDGTNLHAWRFHAPEGEPAKCAILMFHGNGQNLSTHFASLYWILEHGYDYMIFDYHGYGSSEGQPSPKATVEDGHAALREMLRQFPDKKIVVFAQSLGGAVGLRSVLDMKSEVPVPLVIADSTFASYRSVARSALAHSWLTWLFQPIGWLLMSDTYAPKNFLGNLAPTRLIVIHGDADRQVDISMGRDVFNRASEPKEFWEIAGGHHIDALWRIENRTRLLKALDSACR